MSSSLFCLFALPAADICLTLTSITHLSTYLCKYIYYWKYYVPSTPIPPTEAEITSLNKAWTCSCLLYGAPAESLSRQARQQERPVEWKWLTSMICLQTSESVWCQILIFCYLDSLTFCNHAKWYVLMYCMAVVDWASRLCHCFLIQWTCAKSSCLYMVLSCVLSLFCVIIHWCHLFRNPMSSLYCINNNYV